MLILARRSILGVFTNLLPYAPSSGFKSSIAINKILGLLFFDPFLELVNYVSHGKTIEHAIANAHMLFNITGVLIFVWTLPVFEKILNKILPDAKPS